MFKHIFIVFLCFVLLFLAFDSSYLECESIFDTVDGHKQLFSDVMFPENTLIEEGDFIVSADSLYVFTSGGKDFSSADYKKVKDNTLNDQIWDLFLNIDKKVDNPLNSSLFYGDHKIDVWYSSKDPLENVRLSKEHYCDLWYNPFDDSCGIFNGQIWMNLEDELVSTPYTGMPSFNGAFSFGYELTIGTIEVVTSIFKGPEAFFDRFDQWRVTVFGDVTVWGFLTSIVERSIDFLDSIALKIPVVRELKQVIDNILLPFENIISDVVDWINEKIG